MRPHKQLASVIALALVSLLGVQSAGATVTDRDRVRARAAAHFLARNQSDDGEITNGFSPIGSTADAIVSLVAARRGRNAVEKAIEYLGAHEAEVDTVGENAKVIQALVAYAPSAGPRDFEGRNLVKEIKDAELENGHFGEDTEVYDQANALIALRAARATPSAASVEWLADAQCPDGGWEFDEPWSEGVGEHCDSGAEDFSTSDTNTTSLAVQAFQAIPEGTADYELKKSPFAFFKGARDAEKRGWGYAPGFITDANSTALTIQAYVAAGRALPAGSKDALRRLQYPLCKEKGAAAFNWEDPDEDGKYTRSGPSVGATVQAILGFLEKPYPIRPADVTKPARAPNCP